MSIAYRMLKDFWQTALATWLILVLFELLRPGMVQRFINLEYWLYSLIVLYIILRIVDR